MQESAKKARKTWKTCRDNRGRTGPEQGIAALNIAITAASEK
jgi:hypothetical protein